VSERGIEKKELVPKFLRRIRMNVNVRRRPLVTLGCLVLVSGAHSAAQEANEAHDTTPKFELSINRVLVPVVVRDQQGRTVGGLKKEDFQVFDNDKLRIVSAFTVERRGSAEAGEGSSTEGGAQPPAPADAAPPAPKRFIVLLFDDLNLSFADLAYAKKAGVRALDEALADSNTVVVVSISGQTNSGWTHDRTKLQDAIMSLQTQALYRPDELACPKIDYYQADLIVNKNDTAALADAVSQLSSCRPIPASQGGSTTAKPDALANMGRDPQQEPPEQALMVENAKMAANRVLSLGRRDLQTTYATMAQIVGRMASLPGQRIVILVSSGLPEIQQELWAGESQITNVAAQANVTISALDARGVYTTSLTASDHNNQGNPKFRSDAMASAGNTMAELANGTGGTFSHNNNDPDAGFKSLIAAPEVVYVLELSLDNVKPDGHYHSLKVKVDREGVQLQARRGYLMPKPEKSKK
jgi:VWFA-related protein